MIKIIWLAILLFQITVLYSTHVIFNSVAEHERKIDAIDRWIIEQPKP